MNTLKETQEKLGPLDLGPERKWLHLGPHNPGAPAGVAFCGEVCRVRIGLSRGVTPQHCPDCVRISRSL